MFKLRLARPLAHRLAPLGLLVLGWLMVATPALAHRVICRTDPLILLSNGAIIDLSADVEAPLWEVQAVDYVLHVPVGVSLIAAIPTPSWPGTVERFYFYADNPPGKYTSIVTVHTEDQGVWVRANTLSGLRYYSVSGEEGQALRLDFQR